MSPESDPNDSQRCVSSSPSDTPSVSGALVRSLMVRPLVTIAIAFAVGLWAGDGAQQYSSILLVTTGLTVIACSIIWLSCKDVFFSSIASAALACGVLWWMIRDAPPVDDVSRFVNDVRVRNHVVRLRSAVIGDVEQTANGSRLYIAAKEIASSGWHADVSGKVLAISFQKLELKPGDEIEAMATLRFPDEAGNPGQVSVESYLKQRHVYCMARFLYPPKLIGPASPSMSGLTAWAVTLRQAMLTRTRETMPPPYNDIASRLLFSVAYGMQVAPLPESIVESFRDAGVVHVLVVSGSQVAMFFLAMRLIARRFPRRSIFSSASLMVSIALLGLYFLLCSAPPASIPSLGRATLMVIIVCAGTILSRDVDQLTSLAAAALVLLIAEPRILHHIGFQLSFAAVLGILLLVPTIEGVLKLGSMETPPPSSYSLMTIRPAQIVRQAIALSLSAQIATIPIIAHYFGRVSLVGIVANLFAVPVAAVLIPLGCAGSLLSLVTESFAIFINRINYQLTILLIEIAHFFSQLPCAVLNGSRWSWEDIAVYYAMVALSMAALSPPLRARLRMERIVVAGSLLLTVFLGYQFLGSLPRPLQISCLDVGDGDCIFVRSPEGRTMLIDAGTRQRPESTSDVGEFAVLPYLLMEKVNRLDVVVLTHPHDDHLSGLPTILRHLQVGMYIDSGEKVHSTGYDAVLAVVRDRGIPYRIAQRGRTLQLGNEVSAHFLTPVMPRFQGSRSDLNNNSIAIKIVFRQFSALLGGDIEDEAETRLIALGGNLRATLLKACHHGSKTSNTESFLRAVQPEVTIIPCGPSTFLHPAPETLDRLNAARTRVYRTDLHGAVTVYSDGYRYCAETFRNGREREWKMCKDREW